MPELPEVETIKNVLKPILIGNKISKIDVLRESTIQGDKNVFVNALTNQTFTDITRIGKYIFFHLTNNLVIISHLRMEGKYFEFKEEENNSYYARVVFHLNNGHKVCYDDSRQFGILKLSNESNYLNEKEINKLGPEPFIADYRKIYEISKSKRVPIKSTLLDQTVMCGIGNIYSDEILYACNIHPHTHTNLVTLEEWRNIIEQAVIILNDAIKCGGSTIKSYHPGKGIDGGFQTRIKIYGKEGQRCPKCGKEFSFIKTNGRGTTFCPGCQNKKGNPINVAITGATGSGKSYMLSVLSEMKLDTLSCDEIVQKLYKTPEITAKINKMFNLPSSNEVDKKELRKHLLLYSKDKKRLENFLYPIIKNEIINYFKKVKSTIRFVEVPLLFKAHFEDIFDTIICIQVENQIQDKRLLERNGEFGLILKEINKDNLIDKNINKAEFILNNNEDKNEFKKQILNTVNILKLRQG